MLDACINKGASLLKKGLLLTLDKLDFWVLGRLSGRRRFYCVITVDAKIGHAKFSFGRL